MTRGLLWLPLLVVFFWLAWAGWNEYQKLEAYRNWAQQFERAKYDIYAVLGQNGDELTWGKPTRKGPINLQTFSLTQVQAIRLVVNERVVDWKTDLGDRIQTVALEFCLPEPASAIRVPFTELPLARQWGEYLQREWQRLQVNQG